MRDACVPRPFSRRPIALISLLTRHLAVGQKFSSLQVQRKFYYMIDDTVVKHKTAFQMGPGLELLGKILRHAIGRP
jgi:hypothetical protein